MSIETVALVNVKNSNSNYLGIKPLDQQEKERTSLYYQYIPFTKRSPWISEAPSRRVKLMRDAYLAIYETRENLDQDQKAPYTRVLESLSRGESVFQQAALSFLPGEHKAREIFTELKHESTLEFEQFVTTLTDARPYGMVGAGKGRNSDLAQIITMFTCIYEQKPQNNPLLYAFSDGKTPRAQTGVTAETMLRKGIKTKGAEGDREAVKRYMNKIEVEIERLNSMSDQDLGMTFADDNVKHEAIIRKLKLAFNRLSAKLDYGKRFVNVRSHELLAEEYEIVQTNQPLAHIPKKDAGKIFLMPSGQYYLLDPQGKFQSGLVTDQDLQKEIPAVSRRLLEDEYDEVVKVQHLPENPQDYIKHVVYKDAGGQYWDVGWNGKLKQYPLKKGKAYLLEADDTYGYLDSDGNPLSERFCGSLTVTELLRQKDSLAFKSGLLALTASRGHTPVGDKTNQYRLVEGQQVAEYEHEKIQEKISMRRKKLGVLVTAIVMAVLLTVGQVAIAVFTATGFFAILIGAACCSTNIPLFTRDIRGMFLSFIKGELTRGLGWKSKTFLGLWFLASLATAIVAGGLVMLSLVSIFGFVISTAPAWLALGAGIIAAITVVGMTALFFQVGAGIVQSLRGKTLSSVLKSARKSLKSFITPPEFNKELRDLQDQADDYRLALENLKAGYPTKLSRIQAGIQGQIEALREEYRPIRAHLRREKFNHYARFGVKFVFTLIFVPLAFIAAFVATYAFSVISVKGTADTLKMVMGWNDAIALSVSNVLTAISGVVNGVLSAKNLFSVGVSFAAKMSKITVGVVYGIGSVVNITYHGKLWQTIKNGFEAFRANPLKTLIPTFRLGVAVAFGVAIVLNGYGNGATAGGGAINSYYLPQWLLKLVSPSTLTVILATASSMALNKAAIDDAFKTDTPILNIENPNPAVRKRKHFDAFFDAKARPNRRADELDDSYEMEAMQDSASSDTEGGDLLVQDTKRRRAPGERSGGNDGYIPVMPAYVGADLFG